MLLGDARGERVDVDAPPRARSRSKRGGIDAPRRRWRRRSTRGGSPGRATAQPGRGRGQRPLRVVERGEHVVERPRSRARGRRRAPSSATGTLSGPSTAAAGAPGTRAVPPARPRCRYTGSHSASARGEGSASRVPRPRGTPSPWRPRTDSGALAAMRLGEPLDGVACSSSPATTAVHEARRSSGAPGVDRLAGERAAPSRRAAARATSSGIAHGAPRPTFASVIAKRAWSAATQRSHICASRKPPA